MAYSKLYNILSGLASNDEKLYDKLSSLDNDVFHLDDKDRLVELLSSDLGSGDAPSINAFSNVKVGANIIAADLSEDAIEVVAGTNVSLSADTANDKLIINADSGNYYGICSSALSTVTKIVDCSGYVLNPGNIIAVKFTNASAKDSKLNVNSTGSYLIKRSGNNVIASPSSKGWAADDTVTFVFDGVYYQILCDSSDYDTTIDRSAYQIYESATKYIALSAIYKEQLLFQNGTSGLMPLNTINGGTANTSKTLTQSDFDPFGKIFVYTGTASIAAGSLIPGANIMLQKDTIDLRVTFNCTQTTFSQYQDFYLVCKPLANGKVRLVNSSSDWSKYSTIPGPISNSLPTSDDGLVYIYLGHSHQDSKYQFVLNMVHPCYWYKNGGIRSFTGEDQLNLMLNGSGSSNSYTADWTETNLENLKSNVESMLSIINNNN